MKMHYEKQTDSWLTKRRFLVTAMSDKNYYFIRMINSSAHLTFATTVSTMNFDYANMTSFFLDGILALRVVGDTK